MKSVFRHLGCPLFPHQNLGDSNRYGKNFGGFCSQYLSRKSHGSVPKNSKQFWCSGEKTGSGGKLPPPTCNTRVKSHFQSLKAHGAALISVSLALSRTPAEAARPRGQCVAWYARLLPAFAGIHQPTPEGWHAEELKCYTTGNNEHKIYKNPKLARKCRKINMGAPYTEKKHTT